VLSDIRAEQTARETIVTSRLEQERIKRKANEEIRRGLENIAALKASGPIWKTRGRGGRRSKKRWKRLSSRRGKAGTP
jgi:hypothetical protein